MYTKTNPGKFDCYARALPDEPMFILLARDPDFQPLIMKWASRRTADINCGERPVTDRELVSDAFKCAFAGEIWRRDNMGKWREPQPDHVSPSISMKLVKQEFDKARKFVEAYQLLLSIPVTDDDFPHAQFIYETALADFIQALKNNGRV